jgi:hypothetical protein
MDGSTFDALYSFGVGTNAQPLRFDMATAQTTSFSWSTSDVAVNVFYAATNASIGPLILIANAEEDYEDILDSDAALAEAQAKGTKSWRRFKRELGR